MKRAASDEQKSYRRQQILEQARLLLNTRDFEDVTLTDVADALDLVKGTLYRYFPTKEALVLEVLEQELEEWLESAQQGLSEMTASNLEAVAEALARTLAARPLLIKLFSIVHIQLERHLSVERLVAFKKKTAVTLTQAAALLEAAWPPLEGRGPEAVLGLYELAIGVGHLTTPSSNVREALETPGLEVFRLDFQQQLGRSLSWLFRGLASRESRSDVDEPTF